MMAMTASSTSIAFADNNFLYVGGIARADFCAFSRNSFIFCSQSVQIFEDEVRGIINNPE